MASQTLISTRTTWTPTMERYFIDLMLDQLHRGNRLGHTFNKQAWTDMLTMFNAKFGTKYDRDTLKSHYSMLWKQFNDVKNVLDQNGFSWDDHRKMVVADANVWDAYVKVQPDAQSYRNKALVTFNDLCLIYAYTQADGRYSRSSHDVDLDDDIPGVNIEISCHYVNQRGSKNSKSVGTGSIVPASGERSKTDWKPSMDKYFIELMLDQLQKGNKTSNTFSKQAWKNMLTLFNAKFGSQYGKSFLRHRYKKLFKYYTDVRSLLEQKGFSWDEKQQMVVADDRIWEKYIKTHPDARSYRMKSLLNYQDLGMIYGNASNNGLWGHARQDKNFEDNIFEVKTGEEKEGHSSAGSDGLITYWTPPIDSYLTDLLLDQALRGNKIGNDFIAQAWTEMVTLFNSKFGSQYHRDALKKRYKHLRKLYNDIRVLLEHSGFSWDDTQEMVTAADCVWDSYIKAYPNAQSYRNKSVPSYHKLSLIYGQESDDGRNSRLAYNKDLDNGGPDLMIEGDIQFQTNSDCSRTDWTPSMDRHLIDLLLEQVHKGNRIGYTFNNDAWIEMALSFMERFGLQYNKDLLRSRHKSLGKQYNEMKNLVDQIGFSWDEKRQMVTAYDDAWNGYIKEHPDVRSYITEPKPNYNDLCLIFGNSPSDGRDHRSGQDISCNGDGPKLSNGYCLRTDWTPPMDRFFIDLMFEQVRHGSMVDQKFNKQAWGDMVAKFSVEFGSQHDKDVLKSRFMNLRKRFNDMKNLIDQNGFTWDEMRQMITAADDLWDAHIKKHPDARPYRNRTLPNYNDLFLIYGNANTDGRHNYSSHSIDVDAENYALRVNIGEADDQSPASSDPLRICWTKPMDSYFIDLMLEQVRRGNKIGHTFNEQAWAWMIASFNEKYGLLCDNDVLENRYISLMKEHDDITYLLNQNGFAWDEIHQTVIGGDDVWKAYIKEHPEAITYRCRSLNFYNDLCMIYGHKNPVERFSYVDIKMEMDNIDNIFGDLVSPAREFEIFDQTRKRKSATSSTSSYYRKVQRPFKDEIQEAFDNTMANNEEDRDYNSIETVVDALQAIPDMDDELFLEACKLLEDDKKVKMFMAMDVNQRRKWLLKKLRR